MKKLRQFGRDAATCYIRWSPVIAGTLMLFLVLFFADAYCVGLGNILISPTTIGWVTAIATFAAAVAALYLAVRSERRALKKERFIGQLEAAQYSAYVDSIRVSAVSLRCTIPEPAPPPPSGTPFDPMKHSPSPGSQRLSETSNRRLRFSQSRTSRAMTFASQQK